MPKAVSVISSFVVAVGVAFGCLRARGELSPKFKPIAPCPVLLEAAATNQISVTQWDRSSESNALCAGDSATFLGTLVLQTNRTQWILSVEAKAPNSTNTVKQAPFVINLLGTPMSFESMPVPARLRMLGPFSVSGASKLKPQRKDTSFSLNESFLAVGLDQAAVVILRRTKETNSIAKAKLTLAEKRALTGAVPALMSYFDIVQHTEGLEDLLIKLIKTPSLWSIVRHHGVNVSLFFGKEAYAANPADWDLPASAPVYYLPADLQINGQVALKVTLVVTAPHPPLLICGGVIGLLAEKPGDNASYMTLRVISARRGAESRALDQNELNRKSANN
jgi:hypothetical protein